MRAAIYVRVSTSGQVETHTIEQQMHRLQEHINAQAWLLEPEHIYRDDGYSGSRLARPGLDSLRDRAAFAEFDVVLVTAPDRLARNYVHQMLVFDELEQRGIEIEFLDRPMSDDPHDRLLLQIRGAVAEYERTLISDRMRRGRLMKYRTGQLLPWTRAPYGYRLDPDQPRDPEGLRIDETEAALYQVARHLTDLGLPTPTGKARWGISTVRGILKNMAYIGVTYANRIRTEPAKKRHSALQAPGARGQSHIERPQSEWIAITVPVIVDMKVFDQVQEKLGRNQQMATRNNKTHQYLLRRLVSCGLCRRGASGRTIQGKYHYYECRGHSDSLNLAREERCTARFMPATQLDKLVWDDLCQILLHPNMITQALERAHGGEWLPQQLKARIENLVRVDQQIERQRQRLLDAYLAEALTLVEFERKQAEIDKKQRAVRTQKRQLEATAAERLELSAIADSIESFCRQVQPALDQATFAQKRQLVELLIDRVVVIDENVEIRYVIPTQSDGPHIPFCHLHTDYRTRSPCTLLLQTSCQDEHLRLHRVLLQPQAHPWIDRLRDTHGL